MKPKDKGPTEEKLLDPDAFWEGAGAEETTEPDAGVPAPEDDDMAVVVSEPLPEPEILARVTPGPAPPGPLSEPASEPPSKTQPVEGPPAAPRTKPPRPRQSRPPAAGASPMIWVIPLALIGIAAGVWLLSGESGVPEQKPPAGQASTESPPTVPPAPEPGVDPAGPEKAAAAGKGTLSLTSEPTGAVVFLDGEKRGATPTTIKGIAAGATISIRIEAEGFRPWTQEVTFDGGDLAREFHAGLTSEVECPAGSGWVYVNSKPPGATVELDGKRQPGKTPMVINSVCAGRYHKIRLQALGYKTWWKEFEVGEGSVVNLDADLKK